jgi:putative ABC transport system permease protein
VSGATRGRGSSLAGAIYRVILRLLPAEMRDRFGDEIERLFLAELRAARARGIGPWLGTWICATWDVIRRAPREHWRRRGRRAPEERSMHSFLSDLRFALRTFARQKGATALVLLTLTLAVAANTAVFTLINGLFLRPFPFPQPDRLVYLNERAPKWTLDFVGINYPDFDTWRRTTHSFEALALLDETSVNLADGTGADRVRGALVTHDFPAVLGIRPLLGRTFTPEEDRPNGPNVVVIGEGLWRTRFAGTRDIVGKALRINSQPYTVIGVVPSTAEFPGDIHLWLPRAGDPNQPYQSYSGDGFARLKRGVTVEQARADLMEAQRPIWRQSDTSRTVSPRIDALHDRFVSNFKVLGKALGAGVVLVLLIACANVAGAMLARATFRQRELSIRMALGASGRRVSRQMLTEALALAAIAGVAGTVLGWWGIRLLVVSVPDRFPQWVHLGIDARVVAFSIAIVGVTAVLFGLVPALQARRQDVRDCLAAGSTRSSASLRQRRMLDVLVVIEIALAAVLLVAGGLLTRAFANVRTTDPGFRVDSVATFRLALPSTKYPNGVAVRGFYDRLLARVRALPGVKEAGAISCPPLTCHQGSFYEAEGGTPTGPDGTDPVVLTRTATSSYFSAMGIQFVHGRVFAENEGAPRGMRPVVVNDLFAARMWPGVADATGRRFRFRGDTAADRWLSVVGVVQDAKHYGLDQPMRPGIFMSTTIMDTTANGPRSLAVVIRTSLEPSALFPAIRAAVRELDPELPVFELRTMREMVDRSLSLRRMLAFALGGFAAIALTLAVGGIYAVLSYVVGRRRREIGIRMALGAQRGQVIGLVVRQGAGLVLAGVGLGLPLAWAATRVLDSTLVGVTPRDPLTYGLVVAVLLATGLAATLVPARRAATVDPTVTLSE